MRPNISREDPERVFTSRSHEGRARSWFSITRDHAAIPFAAPSEAANSRDRLALQVGGTGQRLIGCLLSPPFVCSHVSQFYSHDRAFALCSRHSGGLANTTRPANDRSSLTTLKNGSGCSYPVNSRIASAMRDFAMSQRCCAPISPLSSATDDNASTDQARNRFVRTSRGYQLLSWRWISGG